MACFLIPAAEAIVTTIATRVVRSREKSEETMMVDLGNGKPERASRISFSRKLQWLSNLLWGGSVLLAFEHVWHGEVTPWAPFLTAAANPADCAEMLHEMSTAGVSMAVLVTVVWIGMVLVSGALEKKALKPVTSK